MLGQHDGLQTSSVGRLFDGVASLLGLADKVSYEGEAAMQLEALAKSWFRQNGLKIKEDHIMESEFHDVIPVKKLIQQLLQDLQKNKPKDYISAKFHMYLIGFVENVAQRTGCRKLAFSGGVFQNELLVDLLIHYLQGRYDLYFHRQLSPNDESVSFGQLISSVLIPI